MQQRRYQDPVIGLLTGRYVMVRDSEGKLVKSWRPQKTNPNPPLSQLLKEKGFRFSEDEIMIQERLRASALVIDKTVFVKTNGEKARLKEIKAELKSTLVKAGFNPSQRLNLAEPMTLRSHSC